MSSVGIKNNFPVYFYSLVIVVEVFDFYALRFYYLCLKIYERNFEEGLKNHHYVHEYTVQSKRYQSRWYCVVNMHLCAFMQKKYN